MAPNKPAMACSENEEEKRSKTFTRRIVLESLENSLFTNFSPFIIQKIISTHLTPKTVKKLRNGTILIEVEQKNI